MSDQTPPDDGPVHTAIEPIEIQEEMESSFLDYAMSVITARALPDARDGLKPVHRRILYGMDGLGARPDRSHMKCARITGDVMGKYHPHGEGAIYDSLVRMAQDFSLRHPLVDGHGNFGSPDFGPAASRYTEARLSQLAMRMLDGIGEDTVDFNDNYSGDDVEPSVLPARFPNLLVNGSQAIAVGMATNIPPHNLGEVIDATVHLIDNPGTTPDDLMQFVQGPDFPTGALIMGRQGILDAYRTGKGSIRLRAVCEIEEGSGRSGDQIVVTEMPYQTSISVCAARIAELVQTRSIEGISDVNDESARGKTRLVIKLKKDAPGLVILNNLYKHTPLQTNFAVNTVALVDGVPRTLNLVQALQAYVDHQVDVIRRRSEYRLKKAQDRAHIVEGLLKAVDVIDQVIALIRGSEDRSAARTGLMAAPFEFSDVQAEHILDLRLGQLTRLAKIDLETELATLRETIGMLEAILGDEGVLRTVIKNELAEVKEKFADERRSKITFDVGDMNIEDLIDDEELIVTLSAKGYIKTVAADAFRAPGSRRTGRRRGQAARRGLRQPHPHHHRPRLPAVLLQPRSRLPPEGARDPEEGAHRARHRDAQPAAAAARRAHPDDHRHTRLRDEPLPLLRHQEGPGQEDQVQRVRLLAANRHHRDQPPRQRRAREGHPHQWRRRHPHAVQARPGDPLFARTTSARWAAPRPACGA